MDRIRVLALQPYFGGSHSQFHNGWVQHSVHQWTTLTLPARHWKWRMRHSGIYFAEKIKQLQGEGQGWDVVLCTDMLNLAEFKGLADREISELPTVMYFHENQFVYPNRFGKERDRHFAFTNFISALAANEIWFNSRFNFDSLVAALTEQVKKWPDFQPTDEIASLESKMHVQPPGIDPPPIDLAEVKRRRESRVANGQPLHLIWAARWEHDKNPDDLLRCLLRLEELNVPFNLSVLGQSFRTVPPVFNEIKTRFENRIVRWGYQESRQEYWEALAEADIFISTAVHEFFGLSAAEAISTGLFPLLPNRVAYPELLGYAFKNSEINGHLFEGSPESLADCIVELDRDRSRLSTGDSNIEFLAQLIWSQRVKSLDSSLGQVVSGKRVDP